jgi:HlyD family secretion protein
MKNNSQLSAEALAFAPDIERVELAPASPLPRLVLYLLLSLVAALVVWMHFGRLDVVAVAQGKLVPQNALKIVQPAEAGIVREILVKEGDAVREGQVLARMDARIADADTRVLRAEVQRKSLQLRRIDAELGGTPLKRQSDDPPELAAQVDAQLQARRQAHLDALGAEQALRARAQHDLGSASEVHAKLEKTTPIYREQERAWEQLAREGFAGRLMALERSRGRIEAEQDLKAQARNIEGLKATIAQSDKRVAQIQSSYRQQLHNERAEAEGAYQKLQQEWAKQQHRQALLELVAPHAGVVKDLATHTPGTVVAPGTILLTLVPRDEPLLAEVWVMNADAGFVQPEQKARIKFASYPFQRYGLVDGKVRLVSADAQDKAVTPEGATRQLQELAYRALIELDAESLRFEAQTLKLVPGMLVTAEVHIGDRSVLEYLLSPIRKVAAEAARER